jgi:hypothetical protein
VIAALKLANLALSFLLELAMLAAFAYWGFHTSTDGILRIVLGIGAPLIAIVVWGIFLAPRSSKRLTGIQQLILATIIFGLAVIALVVADRPDLGVVLGVAFIINRILIAIWKQDTTTDQAA